MSEFQIIIICLVMGYFMGITTGLFLAFLARKENDELK